MSEKNNFRFWVPLDSIVKGKDAAGKQTMKVSGLASTKTTDMDGESLDPEGFDISYLKNKGIINWNHNKSPNAIIGEPTKATITKAGLHVEAELYPDSELAKQVYSLAETLEKSSKTRRLGFSIEGKATERDELDPTKVTKALVTNIALTISPKNPDSIVNIIKGNFNELGEDELKPYDLFNDEAEKDFIKSIEANIEKSACAGSQSGSELTNVPNTGASLKTESVDGKTKKQLKKEDEDDENDSPKTLTKAAVINTLMNSNSVISFEKANQIYETLNSISTMDTTKTTITDELLNKALSTLGITPAAAADETLTKGADNDEDADEDDEPVVKKKKPAAKAAEDDDDEDEADDKPDFTKIKKSLDYNQAENIEMFRGVGTLLKGIFDEVKELRAENASLKEAQVDLKKSMDEFGAAPGGQRKSTAKPLAKSFEKGLGGEEDNLEKGANCLSVSQHKNQVLNLLDVMTFEKGFDNEMSKAMTMFESAGTIAPIIAARVKNEKGITLVN